MIEARRGRGKAAKTIALIEAAIRILGEIQPASIRAVCYPWDWVVDETREAERINSWRDVAAFGDTIKRAYRRDYWTTQPKWIEVWSEKGTVRGTLAPVLDKYGITFRVMHGHGSTTAIHAVAEETIDSTKMLTVLYVGDFDPSGMHMSEVDLPERLNRYGGNVELVRVAIAPEDTKRKAAVPHFSAHDKKLDPRHRWFVTTYGDRCHELDALSPVLLRNRIDGEILARLDLDAWDHAIQIEAAEIDSMNRLMARWPSIPVPANKYPAGAA